MEGFKLVSSGEGGLSKCIEELSLRVGGAIIAPLMEEIIASKGGVGSATHVSEVTISNEEGKILVYVGKTRSRPLLSQMEIALGEMEAGKKVGFAIEAHKDEDGNTQAEVLFADEVDFLSDLRHLNDWALANDRVGAGFVSDMVTFFREDIQLRRRFAATLVSQGLAMCEACHRVLKLKGEGAAMRCSQCKQAFYCSRSCQRRAYPGHRRVCTPCPE